MSEQASRQLRNALAFGNTTGLVDVSQGYPRVQVRLTPLEVLYLKIVEQRGFASSMPVGTPVLAHFQGGDRGNGLINGSVHPGTRPALAGAQDVVMFGYGFAVRIGADGVHITGAPDVFIDGNLHVKGEVTAKDATAASVTLSQHKGHSGGGQAPTPGT